MVYIYALNICKLKDPLEYPELLDGLGKIRTGKILRKKQLQARKQSLGAGILLKHYLTKCGIEIDSIYYNEMGKPELEGIFFNLSHSEDYVVLAVAEKKVGVDIEKISKPREGLEKRLFTQSEVEYLQQQKEDRKWKEFYRIWTAKESFVKMTGEGIAQGLDNCEIQFADRINVYRDGNRCSCYVKEYNFSGYQLTVCAEEEEFADDIIWISLNK